MQDRHHHDYNSKYCMMWMKNKGENIIGKSWEEEEEKDAVQNGPAGGVVWAPASRSYSCGFCSRQFRSAQALGGHMNVHRRDRARLIKHLQDQEDQLEAAPAPAQLTIHNINAGYNNNKLKYSSTSNSSLSSEKDQAHDHPHHHDLHLCIGLNIIGRGGAAAAADCEHHNNHNHKDHDQNASGCRKKVKVISAHDDDNVAAVPTLPCFLYPACSRSRSCGHTPRPSTTAHNVDLELRLATPNYY